MMNGAPNFKTTIEERPHLTAKEGVAELKKQLELAEVLTLKTFLLSPDNKEKLRHPKIVIAGPKNSGKSCLSIGLKDAVAKIPGAVTPFVFNASPDGEGSWFQETAARSPELARSLKEAYKGEHTEEYVQLTAEAVAKLGNEDTPLNLIDLGGMTTEGNAKICREVNAAIIVAGEAALTTGQLKEWGRFFKELGVPVIAEIYSDRDSSSDLPIGVGEDGIFRGSVHSLKRGELLTGRATIDNLAKYILTFNGNPMPEERSFEGNIKTYHVRVENDILRLSFGASSLNTVKVTEAIAQIDELISSNNLPSGNVLKINGQASLPIISAITDKLSKLYSVIAIFDPKINGYVVSVSSNPVTPIGSFLEEK